MPRFLVRVFTQCGPPGGTPDQENGTVQLAKRMLYEQPPFMAQLPARAGEVQVESDSTDPSELAMMAARKAIPEGQGLDLVQQVYEHHEVGGTYVQSGGGGYVFILGTQNGTGVVPLTDRKTLTVKSTAMTASGTPLTKTVEVEFRCHLVVAVL